MAPTRAWRRTSRRTQIRAVGAAVDAPHADVRCGLKLTRSLWLSSGRFALVAVRLVLVVTLVVAGAVSRVMFSIFLGGTLTVVGALKLLGRGRPEPLLDENGRPVRGSISEKAFADINGVRQGMFIQSVDPFHGIYDYTVNYQLAKDYFDRLKAPVKGFYSFDRSAHSPILEEPGKARKILREDVLAGAKSLADDPRR